MPTDEASLKLKLEEFKQKEREARDYVKAAKAWLAENESSASAENVRFAKDNLFKAELSIKNAELNQGAVEEQLKMINSRGAGVSRGGSDYQRPVVSAFENTKWQLPNYETLWLKRNGRFESYEVGPGFVDNAAGSWSQTGDVITLRINGWNGPRKLNVVGDRLQVGGENLPRR